MKHITYKQVLVAAVLLMTACKKYSPKNDPITFGASYTLNIVTDKAAYKPGETVHFSIDKTLTGNITVRYRYMGETLKEETLNGNTWQWTAPATDFTGYMVDLYEMVDGKEKVYSSTGVDVSSDWVKFPRYGFLSKFGQLSNADIGSVISSLNRYHINGVQFQDWHYKHHMPLAGTASAPFSTWKDIANRDTYAATIKGYIDSIHKYNMKAMFYNLGFGALNDAAADGVQDQWYVYKDNSHSTKDVHVLPKPPFKSDIYLLDPSNTAWQQYIANRNKDVYAVYNFDGFHVDQLGDRGALYNYNGNAVNLAATFQPLLQAMKTASSDKKLVMNAVNQYGQQGITASPVDFLYTEVWSPNEGYKDLATIIQNNDMYSNNTKKTVLAAYMNYNLADNAGYFNTPGVLLADAVIFSFGGSHLELGEHMLGKEYFPNSNLQMRDDLKLSITRYYDFLVAYQNLLRDGGTFNTPQASCTNGKASLANWPPQNGKVAVNGKEFAKRQVLHLLNFANATSFDWRDTNGSQTVPNTIQDMAIRFTTTKTVSKVWVASPDINYGVANNLAFTQTGNDVSFTLPSLKYWNMVVVEYQ